MQPRLYLDGYIFFDGVQYSDKLKEYLFNLNNYMPGEYGHEKHTSPEIYKMPMEFSDEMTKGIPANVLDLIKDYSVVWGAVSNGKGFSLKPHRDYFWGNQQVRDIPATMVMWLCPDEFEGREFVYGKMRDVVDGPHVPYEWDDPSLETMGIIKPRTGLGIILDRANPQWWHGVKELTSDHRVITITGLLK